MDQHLYHLEKKTRQLTTRLRLHDSHLQTLNIISGELKNLSMTTKQETPIPPLKEGNHQPSSKPANTNSVQHNAAEQAGGDSFDSSHRQLFQTLGCPPPHDSTLHSVQDALDSLLCHQNQEAKKMCKKSGDNISSVLASYLNSTSCATRLLVDALLQDTPYQSVHLLDERLRSRISKLEMEVNQIGTGMEVLRLDKLSMPCKERDEFIKRWDN